MIYRNKYIMKQISLINKLSKGLILFYSIVLLYQCTGNERLMSEDEDKIVIRNGREIEFVLIKDGFRYGFQKTDGTILVPAHPVSGFLAGSPEDLSQAESTKYLGELDGVYSFEAALENKKRIILRLRLDTETALFELENPEDEASNKCIFELIEACDNFIPEPKRDVDKPFLMPVEDVFSISGRGTVATGRIERGVVKVGEEIEIVGITDTVKTTVTGVEMFRKLLDEGLAGDNVGILLRGTKREDIQRGQVLAAPGSITPHTKFKAECYILSKEEGGRHTPFFNGYRPQFYFRTTDVTGIVTLESGVEMVMPGDNVTIEGTLITPIAMEDGLRFAIREGGRTVGAGVINKIIE